jgi:hypothetical protein
MALPHVTQEAPAPGAIIEMDRFEPFQYGARQTLEDNTNVFFRDKMPPIAARLMVRESDFSHRIVSVLSSMPM